MGSLQSQCGDVGMGDLYPTIICNHCTMKQKINNKNLLDKQCHARIQSHAMINGVAFNSVQCTVPTLKLCTVPTLKLCTVPTLKLCTPYHLR